MLQEIKCLKATSSTSEIPSCLMILLLNNPNLQLLCLGAHAPRHVVVSSCICMYLCICITNFLKVGKNKKLENAVQAQNAVQHDNISNLIVLDFE